MAIVIESIPSGQELDTTAGVTSPLSMTVSGLDDTDLGDVTAALTGPYYSYFVEPPVVSSITESNGQFAVVLTLTGTLTNGTGGSADLSGELTVTITQGSLSSDPVTFEATYFYPTGTPTL
jgi:hypothetical protein